jgi:hypothetical protein
MLTLIGKNLVYVLVIFSLVGLGLSVWAVADQTNFTEEVKNINTQISRMKTAENAEREELKQVLTILNTRVSKIPRGPDEIAANKDVSIADALKLADDDEKKLKDVLDKTNQAVIARIALINEMQTLRQKLQAEKETGNTLRTIITPEPAQVAVGHRAFRDIIASLQVAKDEVERRTEDMQPSLYNAAIRLQNLQQRYDSLLERAKELGIPQVQ